MFTHSIRQSAWLGLGLGLMVGTGGATAANLISHYEFEGNTDNSVVGAPNGTLAGDAMLTSDAAVGAGALMLDGAGDYLDTTTAGLPQGSGLYEGTIDFWFKADPGISLGNRQFFGNLNASDTTAILFGTNGAGGLQIFIRSADNSVFQIRNAIDGNAFNIDTTYADGEYHNIQFNWEVDAAGGSGSILVDGVALETQTVLNSLTTANPITPWEFAQPIGARNNRGSLDNFWAGKIDDVKIYDGIVPEPASLAILALGGVVAGTRRRRV
ncbi:MAG: LamG-like jellyroll fold domain-containing protein [Planctomycetota bacterium]